MGYMKELDIELRESVTAVLEKYITEIETANLTELEKGDSPLSQIYRKVLENRGSNITYAI
jgi:hypothetical protein